MKTTFIRNFCIVAHVDHGKSTLADRMIELCSQHRPFLSSRQILDSMDLEKERGITIKAQTARLYHQYQEETYQLNLIDTPGHADFSYEVSRSLYACEGVILLVDATQGVEAQTIAICREAKQINLKIIPVLNKVDLAQADIDRVWKDIKEMMELEEEDEPLCVSAKTGLGVSDLLDTIVKRIPGPTGDAEEPLQAIIIDSWFNAYVGIVFVVCVKTGTAVVGDEIQFMTSSRCATIEKLGVFMPEKTFLQTLHMGEVGFLITGIRDINYTAIGDTITLKKNPTKKLLQAFSPTQPQVFAGLFPLEGSEYTLMKESLAKLQLNDSSFVYQPESLSSLGNGFRCGFLGLLHMDIIRERLEREYDLSLIITLPTVVYHVILKNKKMIPITNPQQLPSMSTVDQIQEPIVHVTIFSPIEYLGNIMQLCSEKRGERHHLQYGSQYVQIEYMLPLAEIAFDFFDHLKSLTKGMASSSYKIAYYKASDLIKVDILINKIPIGAFSKIEHRNNAVSVGKRLVQQLRNLLPRQMFEIVIQATIESKIIAREEIKALRKNVIAKCYGGDVSRKKKLLQKQAKGKKKMKQIGKIDIPKDVFFELLKV